MTWNDRLRRDVPKADIPTFLTELQALVAALREGRPWDALLTPLLHEHADLTVGYLDPGPAKNAVAEALQATGGHRVHGE
ncbi:MAG: hypothetical protein ACPHID_01210 [Thermoplasmatota archaeon]